ncbi:MAG: hypothetical protein ACT4OO_09730 [Nitrospiraceae bacterium]
MASRSFIRSLPAIIGFLAGAVCLTVHFSLFPAAAVSMVNDPKGFRNIPWGVALAAVPDLTVSRTATTITEYVSKNGPLTLGETPVDTILFSSIDGQFARVTIRYRGETIHRQVVAYLEQQFGLLERIPGQMLRGMNQQFNWRGTETEINVTYEANSERGYVFFESRSLSPRFNEGLADTAP